MPNGGFTSIKTVDRRFFLSKRKYKIPPISVDFLQGVFLIYAVIISSVSFLICISGWLYLRKLRDRLKKWGFWLMITYSVLFGIVSSLQITNQLHQPFIGNLIWSIIVLVYSIYVKKTFFKTNFQH
jgi:hypothetical protein